MCSLVLHVLELVRSGPETSPRLFPKGNASARKVRKQSQAKLGAVYLYIVYGYVPSASVRVRILARQERSESLTEKRPEVQEWMQLGFGHATSPGMWSRTRL